MRNIYSIYKEHYKALISLGLPIVIGQIGVIVLGFADTLMIGHHSTIELGAASFVNNCMELISMLRRGRRCVTAWWQICWWHSCLPSV